MAFTLGAHTLRVRVSGYSQCMLALITRLRHAGMYLALAGKPVVIVNHGLLRLDRTSVRHQLDMALIAG